MLDNITKKNIDDCRDVLVGKVPDPKSQIEQITLALIYKFMDDMDKEAVEKFKGKAKFFTGEYAKFGWRKLFDPSLNGTDMLALYSEALEKLNTNPNIPELFRNIFKNAYLPYRDPSTLKLFLKYINEFEYSHSEKLGDAFEYLLSVMGSQGDAGQFRTPRHIIDFVTACVNPQKNETVLDPACGTAGFLLSAYKHILKQNTSLGSDSSPLGRPRGALKPDDRKKLATNFAGYDISPDMVRLSLANMYLHGFTTPQIYEYDTLSSEDRWQETFDVILANPPFMTPKGGIRPHKKFGVQANKAEVLFTDYIAEHLNSNGRAGIVVPNGIVATSQTAYKELRKHLVNDSLIAVVSLPSGVFQPYSGVKTSVLLLDKQLAKKSKHILFLKIDNDGFDLGAQRREHDKNDLPLALQTLKKYKATLNLAGFENLLGFSSELSSLATLVEKKTVLENKDVVLSAERYFETEKILTEFDIVKLGDVVEINSKAIDPVKAFADDTFTYVDIESVENGTGKVSFNKIIKTAEAPSRARRLVKNGDVIISTVRPNLKAFAYLENLPKNCLVSTGFAVLSENEKVNGKYLYYIVNQDSVVKQMISMSDKGQYPSITAGDVADLEIPLPPLEIQQQIVNEIEGYQKIIDGAMQVVNNYKPTTTINPDWEMVALADVCEINPKKSEVKNTSVHSLVSFLPMADLNENQVNFKPKETRELSEVIGGYTYFRNDDVLFAKVTPCFENGKAGIAKDLENGIGFGSSEYYVLRSNKQVLPMWLYLQIKSLKFETEGKAQMSGTSGLQRIPKDFVSTFQIPLPIIEEQKAIVKALEKEMQIVEGNKELIQLFEAKIKNKIAQVWGVKEEVEA